MDHQDKITKYLLEVPRPGFGRRTAAPPLYRLAWWAGLRVRPPVFQPFWSVAVFNGTFSGVVFGVSVWLLTWLLEGRHSSLQTIALSACMGVFVGLFMGRFYGDHARTLKLPNWDDYGGA
jgi:hypothetical protein